MQRQRRYFVGEAYQPDGADAAAGSASDAAAALAGEGRTVRHLWSLFDPEDELCLHLFEADSAETVAELGRRAATPFDRVWAAVRLGEADAGMTTT